MSDCMSSGYWADEAIKIGKTKCKKGGRHVWVEVQKDWQQCKKCKIDRYFK